MHSDRDVRFFICILNAPHLSRDNAPWMLDGTPFSMSKSIFGVNVRVAEKIFVFKVKSCLGAA